MSPQSLQKVMEDNAYLLLYILRFPSLPLNKRLLRFISSCTCRYSSLGMIASWECCCKVGTFAPPLYYERTVGYSGCGDQVKRNQQAGVRAVHLRTRKAARGGFGIRRSALGQPGGICDRRQRQDDGVHADRRNGDESIET